MSENSNTMNAQTEAAVADSVQRCVRRLRVYLQNLKSQAAAERIRQKELEAALKQKDVEIWNLEDEIDRIEKEMTPNRLRVSHCRPDRNRRKET